MNHSKNLTKKLALGGVMAALCVALLYLLYIPLCLRKSASLMSFLLLTGICLLQSVCIALWTICEYKLSYL